MNKSILSKWQDELKVHTLLPYFKNMSMNTRCAIYCQTMNKVTGGQKRTKTNKNGLWNFFFKETLEDNKIILEVFSHSHRCLRRYIDFDFNNPEFPVGLSAENEKMLDKVWRSLFPKQK